MRVLAIDPGLSGAIACIEPNHHVHVADMPVVDTGLDRYIDGRALYDQLLQWVPATERCILVVEDVRVRNTSNGGERFNSTASQTSLIRSRGIIEGATMVARMPIIWCAPQKWKAAFALRRDDGDTDSAVKEKSRQMALRLFPAMGEALKYKNSHNRAESLLMAHWGRSTQL